MQALFSSDRGHCAIWKTFSWTCADFWRYQLSWGNFYCGTNIVAQRKSYLGFLFKRPNMSTWKEFSKTHVRKTTQIHTHWKMFLRWISWLPGAILASDRQLLIGLHLALHHANLKAQLAELFKSLKSTLWEFQADFMDIRKILVCFYKQASGVNTMCFVVRSALRLF